MNTRAKNSKQRPDGKDRARYSGKGRCIRILLVICLFAFFSGKNVSAQDLPKEVDGVREGIVRIRSVCLTNLRILQVRERTGFLVGAKGSEPLVVTAAKGLTYTENEKKNFAKEFKLEDNEQIDTQLYMVFQGDVRIDLSAPIGHSDEKNLAVLRPQQSLTDKYVLEFAEGDPQKDMTVYLLSFPSFMNEKDSFSKSTVTASKARVLNMGIDRTTESTHYFFHNISGDEVILGSPFVNAKGKVVGILVGASKDENLDERIALTNKEIMQFLDLHNAKYTVEKGIVAQTKENNRISLFLGIGILIMTLFTIIRFVRGRMSLAMAGSQSSGSRNQDLDSSLLNANGRKKARDQEIDLSGARLLRMSTQETIPVTGVEFLLGKAVGSRGYSVTGNPKVSREHAKITFERGSYYIEDMNSTNGTVVGGRRLDPGKRVKLGSGTTIRLADEQFVFKEK